MTPTTDVTFNLQEYLHDRFQEQRDATNALAEKVEKGFTLAAIRMEEHAHDDTQQFKAINEILEPLQQTYKGARWTIGLAITSMVTYLAKSVMDRLPSWMSHVN